MERSENKRHLSSTDAEGKREARRFQIDGDGERWLGENRKIDREMYEARQWSQTAEPWGKDSQKWSQGSLRGKR